MTTAGQSGLATSASATGLLVRRLEAAIDPESAFVHLYGESANAFWLDSSAAGERGRFSYMGDAGGLLAAVVAYDLTAGVLRIERRGEVSTRRQSIFDFLSDALGASGHDGAPSPLGLDRAPSPLGFDCGFAGYLGYELKADCGAAAAHRSPTPDAALVFADRLVAFDHEEGCVYLLALTSPDANQVFNGIAGDLDADRVVAEAERWVEETGRRLQALPPPGEPEPQGPVELRLRRSEERYLDEIEACKGYLASGDSYEICLTNRFVGEAPVDPLALYRSLRRANPAPFSAYLRFGDLAILSSSPERFLAVDRDGGVEARPIKGTGGRGATAADDRSRAQALEADPKSRAENVTIVDLVRNDLGRVCEPGSVEVSELARVESFETVHQLVSCVRGRLQRGLGAPDCVRACFPPGSMTGAPKLRTMEILDRLEDGARGVYSGAIGYFGLGGAADLSVAIRTIVCDGRRISIGAGGAIVVDSDPRAELEEMLLKARAAGSALAAASGESGFPDANGTTVSPINFS
jgi:para-aminobenzoate synthetase